MRAAADDNTNIIFGATVDERLAGQLWVTVVATGFPLPGVAVWGGGPATETRPPAAEPRRPSAADLEPPAFLRDS